MGCRSRRGDGTVDRWHRRRRSQHSSVCADPWPIYWRVREVRLSSTVAGPQPCAERYGRWSRWGGSVGLVEQWQESSRDRSKAWIEGQQRAGVDTSLGVWSFVCRIGVYQKGHQGPCEPPGGFDNIRGVMFTGGL